MLNKKNIIISGLASVMLTYSFNYIAMAGLDKIKMPNNNANVSINKPSNLVNSASKGMANRYHATILKNFGVMKNHLKTLLPGQFEGAAFTENSTIGKKRALLERKRRKASDLTREINKEMTNEEILNSFNPYEVRLTRLYKDHDNQLKKINEQNIKDNAAYQLQVENHKSKMNETQTKLEQDISVVNQEIDAHKIALSDIDARIKAKKMSVNSDVHAFFIKEVQPTLIVATSFDKFTIGSLSTIAYK